MNNTKQTWQEKALGLLDQSVENLDRDTVYRLQLARGKAFEKAVRQPGRFWKWSAAVASVLVVTYASYFLIQTPRPDLVTPNKQLMTQGNPEDSDLYENLDFYMWLSSKEWAS